MEWFALSKWLLAFSEQQQQLGFAYVVLHSKSARDFVALEMHIFSTFASVAPLTP